MWWSERFQIMVWRLSSVVSQWIKALCCLFRSNQCYCRWVTTFEHYKFLLLIPPLLRPWMALHSNIFKRFSPRGCTHGLGFLQWFFPIFFFKFSGYFSGQVWLILVCWLQKMVQWKLQYTRSHSAYFNS